MTLFIVEVEDCIRTRVFFKETIKRMSDKSDFVKNPFDCSMKQLDKGVYAVSIVPLYPKVYWGSLFFFTPVFVFWGSPFTSAWSMIVFIFGLFVLGLGFLWSKYFYFLMILGGLRKSGYKKRVKLLSNKKALWRFYDGANRSI